MSSDNYPSDWNQRRKRVYRRDEFTCSNCGRKGGSRGNTELHAHHIVPIKSGGSHNTSNLVTLCRGCHKAIHTGSKAPTSSGNFSVADTGSTIGAVSEMTSSAQRFFDEFATLTKTIDDITIVPEKETADLISTSISSLRNQTPQIKKNLNQLEQHEYIQSKENEFLVLIKRYVNTHRELISLAIELIDVIDEILEIFETTRQAKCPNCRVGEALINGTCGKCKATLQVPDDSVWRRFRENRKAMNDITTKFVEKSEDAASAADALTGYFE